MKKKELLPDSLCSYENRILQKLDETSEQIITALDTLQADTLKAEKIGDIELAAIGLCAALETLIKDYAIDELGKPAEEVAVKNLYQVIAEYLLQKDLINTPDLIRILGDDYVHYEDRYPVHDLVILKGYMEIFLKQIEMQYMIGHPEPVAVDG